MMTQKVPQSQPQPRSPKTHKVLSMEEFLEKSQEAMPRLLRTILKPKPTKPKVKSSTWRGFDP